MLHHPCVLGGPQTREQSQRWPTTGRKCYITPAFSGVPKKGDKVNGGPQVGGSATSPLRSRRSLNKGTKSKVAHKGVEVLHHPCVLGGSPTRGPSQRGPTSGRKCYITPAFLGVPNKGTKSKPAHKWAEVLHQPCVLGCTQTRGQSQRWPTSGRKCFITPAFSGVPKQGDNAKGGPQVGGLLHHPCVLGGPQTRGQSQRWPTSGRKCYITPAFWGVPKQGDKVKGGPQVGGSATSPLCSRGSPNKGTQSMVAHKWAEVLHHPCVLGGTQTRGQSERWPTSGRKCYITPAFSAVPKHGDKVKGGPQVGGTATSSLRSRGFPNKGTKSMVAHKWAEVLHYLCVLGGPQTIGQSQWWPTSGRKCYITPAVSGVPQQGNKVKGGPQVSGSATSSLRSRGSPNKGRKSKVAHKWAEVLHHPCVLWGPQTRGQSQRSPTSARECYITPAFSGCPQTRGQSQRWPTSGRKCYITPAFSGVPKQGDKVKGGPQVGGSATSPLRSRGSPNKGTKSMVAHKWAEVLHYLCVLGGPQTIGESQWWPTSGRKCYITPAVSGVPQQGDKVKGGPQVSGSATSSLRSRGSPNKGRKSKVAHKWAEVLHHPCVLWGPQTRGQSQRSPTSARECYITPAFSGCPQTRGQSQRWPTSGRECYITPAFAGVPKQGDKVKGGPQVGGSATSPLRSRGPQTRGQSQWWPTSGRNCCIIPAFSGPPNKGTKSMVAHKWAEVLHYLWVLGGPQTRGQSQWWPTTGRKSYIIPAFSGVPQQGDKIKGGPQGGGSATSALRSRGSPTRGPSQRGPTSGRKCYITPAISGVPNKGTKSKVAHKWAEVLHLPCVLGGPRTRGQGQWWPTSGRKCYIIPPFSGVPKQGDKVKGGQQVGGRATSPLRSQGSLSKGTKSMVATSGQKCSITPAFLGVPKQGDKIKGGPQVGGSATSPLRSRGP